MLYNIFKKRSTLKKKFKKVTIFADIHEKDSLILSELQSVSSIQLIIKPLKIADYIINDIAIERKTISDLISSMISKRLILQLKQMEKYNKRVLIIEGDLNKLYEENSNISKAIRGLIISICINNQTFVIRTKDYKDTALNLITLAKQQIKPKTIISLHSRIPKSLKEQKKYVLESFSNIGPQKAEKLLQKFDNLLSVFNASSDELEPILKSRVKDFKEVLND